MAGYEVPRKPFDLVGIAGIFFLLGASVFIGVEHVAWLSSLGAFILSLPYVAGLILLGLGAIWGTVAVLLEPGHGLLMKKS
jgi:hypothetical protein